MIPAVCKPHHHSLNSFSACPSFRLLCLGTPEMMCVVLLLIKYCWCGMVLRVRVVLLLVKYCWCGMVLHVRIVLLLVKYCWCGMVLHVGVGIN
jgi:hypothetical protein